MLKKISICLIISAVIILNVLRFWKLDVIPDGYHVDEVGTAVTMQCYAESGCDAEMEPWHLYGTMEYGQDKPPTYIYPGLLWVKAFGSTVPSLRAYGVCVFLIGVIGLFFLAQELFGGACALAVVLAATCSPWSWVVTRVALESWFAPVFAIWGLYFFWRKDAWWSWGLAALFFSAAMYTYPPARMQIPLMMITLAVFQWSRRSLRWQPALVLILVFVISLLPLVSVYHQGPSLTRRFTEISIFNPEYLQSIGAKGPLDVGAVFIHNYLLHLTPRFLFFKGDPSFVHSTGHLGLFSGLDIAALMMLIGCIILVFVRRSWQANPVIKYKGWLILMAVNFFIGIIPSALTNQELPHALRICGSWPFTMLFTGLMWWSVIEAFVFVWPVLAVTGMLCGGVLAYQYFTTYQQESRGMFDYVILEQAQQSKTQEDWQKFLLIFHRRNYHCRYFLVHNLGMTCKQANDLWWKMFHFLIDHKLY